MHRPSTISPLEQFQRLFPVTRLEAFEGELHYRFKNPITGRYFEDYAQRIIIENKLPVVADLEVWSSGGYVHEISLVVKMAPEEYLVA